jgi:hypothetical protein
MRRTAALIVAVLLALPLSAQPARVGSTEAKAGRIPEFTFTRIRYGGNGRGFGRGGGAWAHDYPQGDTNLSRILDYISTLRVNLTTTHVFDLDDVELFQHPIAYLSEPGFWSMTDAEARGLRDYVLKGGFLIFDDFEAEQWNNFAAQVHRALPEYQFIEIGVEHPIFHSFFELKRIDVPHPLVRVEPKYYGLFEGNNPRQRMMAIVNYNNDLAEYWEWSAQGYFPVDISNDAYKLGVNYVIYGLTH